MFIRIVILLAVVLLSAAQSSVANDLFGNLQIVLRPQISTPPESVIIQVDSATSAQSFTEQRTLVFWNLRAGRHQVIVTIDQDTASVTIAVAPHLTTRVELNNDSLGWRLGDIGFADQSGAVVLFTSEDIHGMPGELTDALSPFALDRNGAGSFSWEGMRLASSAEDRTFALQNKTSPDLALVNLSDPFVGARNSQVNLFDNYQTRSDGSVSSLYGSRDRRISRGNLNLPLPSELGRIHGAVSLENTEDASPRSNIDTRLPHNSMENLELLGTTQVNVANRIVADAQFLYQSSDRNYYDHDYYFDLMHAPREEGQFYTGQASIYGWVRDNLFMRAYVGLGGEDSKSGDGLYFDDLTAYGRPLGNPRYDATSLYYAFDREPIYDTNDSCIANCGDDGHVYEDFYRYHTSHWTTGLSADKRFGEHTLLSAGLQYSRATYRQFHHLYPTNVYQEDGEYPNFAFLDVIRIGYDSLGRETTDDFPFGDLPSPSQFAMDFGVEHLTDKYFVRGGWHVVNYNYNTVKVKDPASPLDGAGVLSDSDPTNDSFANVFDGSDLEETTYRMYMNYALAAGLHLSSKATVYLKYTLTHQLPPASQIYFDPDYVEYKVLTGGYYFPIANPDLTAVRFERNGVGVTLRVLSTNLTLEYQRKRIRDWIVEVTQPARPRSYSTYRNAEDSDIDQYTAMISYGNRGPLKVDCAFVLRRDDHNLERTDFASVAWTVSDLPEPHTEKLSDYSIASHIAFDPAQLPLAEGGFNAFFKRLRFDLVGILRSGVRYSPNVPYNEVSMAYSQPTPAGPLFSESGRDFFEINAALTARIAKVGQSSFTVKFEVLNLLDRENWLNVYTSSGRPDYTGWLETSGGQEFINYNDTPDQTGLDGEQKYLLKENNPLNFGRPRIIRVMAQLTF